jgi:signal transduction histidine kinase
MQGPGQPPFQMQGPGNGRPPFDGGQPPNGARSRLGLYDPREFSIDGTSLGLADSITAWDVKAIDAVRASGRPLYSNARSGLVDLRILTVPEQRPGQPEVFIQAPYPLNQVEAAIAAVDRALLTLIPIALIIAAVGGTLVTKNVLARIGQLSHSAAQIGANDLSQRLPVVGRDEFAELAEVFNALLTRVELAFREQARVVEQQRRFTADASHELKTPLTVIRGTTSMALSGHGILDRQSTSEIDHAAESMSSLVQDLIYLARSDSGQLAIEPIDLLVIDPLRRAIDRITPISKAPIRLLAAEEDLTIMASENEMVRLFSNILLNAAQHTPAEGRIIVSLSRTTGDVIVMINDSGPGIEPQHLAHLTERFYRVDTARSRDSGGSGLGLAICQGIVDAHFGSMSIESTVGKGTTVTITLPRLTGQVE